MYLEHARRALNGTQLAALADALPHAVAGGARLEGLVDEATANGGRWLVDFLVRVEDRRLRTVLVAEASARLAERPRGTERGSGPATPCHRSATGPFPAAVAQRRMIRRTTMAREYDAAAELHLKKALEDLHREFDVTHAPERIDALMADSLEQIRTQSRVESYLPALAARLTRDRLLAGDAGGAGVPQVLFVGLHDTGRGQLAAALMRAYAGTRIGVHSAGSGRLEAIDDAVRVALAELGLELELDDAYSKPLTDEILRSADVVVTMGRSVGEVKIPKGTRHLDWRVGDPGGAPIDEVRRIRDEIAERVRRLADELAPLGG